MSLNRSPQLLAVAKGVARDLRRRQTVGERLFWDVVRNRGFMGKKFLRQHPFFVEIDGRESFYLVDFYCAEAGLVVEVDGKIHEHQFQMDSRRSAILKDGGLRVLRYRNEDIEINLHAVLKDLSRHL